MVPREYSRSRARHQSQAMSCIATCEVRGLVELRLHITESKLLKTTSQFEFLAGSLDGRAESMACQLHVKTSNRLREITHPAAAWQKITLYALAYLRKPLPCVNL